MSNNNERSEEKYFQTFEDGDGRLIRYATVNFIGQIFHRLEYSLELKTFEAMKCSQINVSNNRNPTAASSPTTRSALFNNYDRCVLLVWNTLKGTTTALVTKQALKQTSYSKKSIGFCIVKSHYAALLTFELHL